MRGLVRFQVSRRSRSGVGKRGDRLECKNPSPKRCLLWIWTFILCLWFHSTKHYRTLMPQYIHFEQNPVFSSSAGSLEYIHPTERIDVAGRPTRGPDEWLIHNKIERHGSFCLRSIPLPPSLSFSFLSLDCSPFCIWRR